MAEQEEPVHRRVALKVIKQGMDTKQVIARFEAERQALALMDHSNIAKVLDAGATETGRPYFVMELVRGIRITDYCDQNQLSTAERLDLFVLTCRAVQHAHQKGVIHRDIKPSNVLVTLHDGVPVPKVIDFGIAKATQGKLTDQTLFTAFEQFLGTPAYMSPEQAEMSGLDVDTRTDIYSLGVLLYELLTGKTPFDAKELLEAGLDEMRRTIREKEPARPSTRLSTMIEGELTTAAKRRQTEAPRLVHLVRGDLDWIVMKCLEKDRTRRYETANGLASDVQRHLANEPVVACPPSNSYRLRKLIRRNKLVFAAAGAVVTALIAGLAVSTWLFLREREARRNASSARQQAERARQNEALLRQQAQDMELATRRKAYASDLLTTASSLGDGNLRLARELLEGHRPRVGQEDLRGFEWRYLWGQSRGDQRRTILAHSDYVNTLAYSPDGTLLASGSSDHTVKLWNPATGGLIATCAGHSREVISVAFSQDGKLLASGSEDGLVRLWDVHTREITATITNRQPRVAFSRHLLAIATGGDQYGADGGIVALQDFALGREAMRLPDSGNRAAFSPDDKMLATANFRGLVQLWDLSARRVTRSFPSPTVRALAFSPDGAKLGWCTDSGAVWLWELAEERPLALSQDLGEPIYSLAFSPDGQVLAVGHMGHFITFWSVVGRNKLASLRGHGAEVAAVAFSPDGKTLASGSYDGTVMFWDAAGPRAEDAITNVLLDRWHSATHPVFSLDGRTLAAAMRSGSVQFWEVAACRPVFRLEMAGFPLAFSADGTFLTRDEQFGSIQAWDASNQTLLTNKPLIAVGGNYYDDAISSDQKMIAISQRGDAGRIILRSTVTGAILFALEGAGSRCLAFSPDNRTLAAGGYDHVAKLWDLASRERVWTLGGFRDTVAAVAFSPDGKLFAAGSWDSTIKVGDIGGMQELARLTGHKEGVVRLTFSCDGRTLASASDDCTVRLWNLATSRVVLVLKTARPAYFLSFSPDGQTLATGGDDGVVKFWRAPPLEQIETAENAHERVQ
jgi:WD40 repeat protein/tRNA A-37 threonylcarbamoyl transferase component Bud32